MKSGRGVTYIDRDRLRSPHIKYHLQKDKVKEFILNVCTFQQFH